MIITAFNPTTDSLEKTYFSQAYAASVLSVEVKNNQRLNNNDRLLIGDMGPSQSEIITGGPPSGNGTTLPISATLFGHPANTSVYQLQFDQVKFYRSVNGINGTYTQLALVNLDVTSADLQTQYDDTTAQASYYYKVSMYNSEAQVESALSDPIPAVTGWAQGQVGYTIDQLYREISDPEEQLLSRDELFGYLNEVNEDLTANVARPYRFLYTRIVLPRVAAAISIPFPTDANGNQLMWKFDRIDYNFVDTTTTPTTNNTFTVEVLPIAYFRNRHQDNTNNANTQTDVIQEIAIEPATKELVYWPPSQTSSGAVFYLYYWQFFTRLTSEGQYFQTPTPYIYTLFVKAMFYRKRAITEPSYLQLADRYMSDYNSEKARYKQLDRTDQGTPRRFTNDDWVTRSFRR